MTPTAPHLFQKALTPITIPQNHDALAYSNRWIDYNASQYQGVCELLTSLVNQETINNSSVETAILTLENLGFDTLPFGVKLDAAGCLNYQEKAKTIEEMEQAVGQGIEESWNQ